MSFCPKERIVMALITQYGGTEALQILECYAIDLTDDHYTEAADVINSLACKIINNTQ